MPDRTNTRLSFVAGLLAALVLVPLVALAVTTSPAAVQDGATFNASAGPEVTAGEDMNVATNNLFPNSETVRLGPVNVSHAGQLDVTLTGADGSLPTIEPQSAPANNLTLAHDNTSLSASVTGGSIDSLALSDSAAVGDKISDIEIDTGGAGTTLRVSGLGVSEVTFIDTSGSQNQELATTSVSNGAASLAVGANAQRDLILAPSGSLNISVSNPSPADGGQIGAQTLLTERLSFDITVPAGVGQVDLSVRRTSGGGESVAVAPAVVNDGTTSVESAQTLQFHGFDFGQNSWQVVATGPFGRTDSASFSFNTSLTFGIRQETAPSKDVPGQVNATIRELVDSDPTILDRQIVSGNLSTDAVEVDEGFIIDLAAPGYYDRAVAFAGAPVQENLYMLNQSNERTAVTSVLEGGTIDSSDAAVQFERAHPAAGVGENYHVIAGDQFGPGAPVLKLQNGTRYRAILIDDDGRSQNMGTFIPEGDTWSVGIDPGVPPITQELTREPWGVGATIISDTGPGGARQETVALRYDDRDGATSLFKFEIYERGNENNVLESDFVVIPNNFTTQYQVAQSEVGNEWVVEYLIYRGGERIEGERVLTPAVDATPDPLSSSAITVIGIGLIVMVAGLFSVLSVGVGAVVTSLVGGLLWWLGWLGAATSGIAVVIALAVSTIYYIAKRGAR